MAGLSRCALRENRQIRKPSLWIVQGYIRNGPILRWIGPFAFGWTGQRPKPAGALFAAKQAAQNGAALGVGCADGVAGAGVCGCFEHIVILSEVFACLTLKWR